MIHIKRTGIIALMAMVFVAMGCKKDYYTDTGVHSGSFDGAVMEYLQSKPTYFDSLIKVIHLAGMDDVFKNEDITFFAPADSSISRTIDLLNFQLQNLGRPPVTRLEQIKPEVWRNQLSRYIFKGKKAMNDYRQIDPENLSAYPGQIYASYNGLLMNIGVIYNDVSKEDGTGVVKYAGYRQMLLSFIPSASAPRDFASWYSAIVASVNVAPTNGYVHVLQYSHHYFGFEPIQFIEEAMAKGIDL